LIELLVVVAIIALLISILMPSLKSAKEQAKLVACESNIGHVGKVLIQYFFDLNQLPVYATSNNALCSWAFGGWSGRNRKHWQDETGYPEWNVETSKRPLSLYALNGGVMSKQKDNYTPTEETPYYKCPSDSISAQWQWSDPYDESQAISAYDDVGTSYQMNWSWWPQTDPGVMPVPPGELYPYFYYRSGVSGVKIWWKMYDNQSSRFLSLYEDPCDYALNLNLPATNQPTQPGQLMLGFHNRFSKHVGFYIDGHAEYRYMDTVHTHDSLKVPNKHKPGGTGTKVSQDGVMGLWTAVDEQRSHFNSESRHQS
jgi:type II secretory pathway pseudopilin PulG